MAGASINAIHKAQRAEGPAAALAIGTAAPTNVVHQSDYSDSYEVELKEMVKHV